MKTFSLPVIAAAALFISACATTSPRPQAVMLGDDRDDVVENAPVPSRVLEAARAAVPGFAVNDADIKMAGGASFYDLEGSANGKKYELAVTAGGRVLQVRRD